MKMSPKFASFIALASMFVSGFMLGALVGQFVAARHIDDRIRALTGAKMGAADSDSPGVTLRVRPRALDWRWLGHPSPLGGEPDR